MRDFDIFSFGYPSPGLTKAATTDQIAKAMLQEIRDAQFFQKYTGVYFVTHSMGGIVVKRMLIELDFNRDDDLLRRVKAVVYLSMPAQGSNLAAFAMWLSANPQLKDLNPLNANAYLQSLVGHWKGLVDRRNRSGAGFPQISCAYEGLPEVGDVVVVGLENSESVCDGNPFPVLAKNHSGIAKPIDRMDVPYPWVRRRLLTAAAMAASNESSERVPTILLYGETETTKQVALGLLAAGIETAGDTIVRSQLSAISSRIPQLVSQGALFRVSEYLRKSSSDQASLAGELRQYVESPMPAKWSRLLENIERSYASPEGSMARDLGYLSVSAHPRYLEAIAPSAIGWGKAPSGRTPLLEKLRSLPPPTSRDDLRELLGVAQAVEKQAARLDETRNLIRSYGDH
jgi:hypothetical protein